MKQQVRRWLVDARKGRLFPDLLRSGLQKAGLFGAVSSGWHEVKEMMYQLAPPRSIEIEGARARFHVNDGWDERQVFDHFDEERDVLGEFLRRLEPDDVFYDVGANVGLYTCLARDRIEDGEVVAFEPNPHAFPRLQKNVGLNDQNVILKQLALSDENDPDAELALTACSNPSGASALATGGEDQKEHFDNRWGGMNTLSVEMRTGDSLIANGGLPQPTVLKIDVEGAEMNVLHGLQDTLSNGDVRLVFVEVHDFIDEFGFQVEDVTEFLEGVGDGDVVTGRMEGGSMYATANYGADA